MLSGVDTFSLTQRVSSLTRENPKIIEFDYIFSTLPCDRCGQAAPRYTFARRSAFDLNLEGAITLQIRVSVHRCRPCSHYFRAQPPFLKPSASYTTRVRTAAVSSVNQDGMAMRQVPIRLARDFWVKPHEKMVRRWCQAYRARLDFEGEYQPWAIGQFSGILGLDEVYQGQLVLLLAVDPAGPDGDCLIGFEVLKGEVTQNHLDIFIHKLVKAGLQPEQIITDGSTLYPAVLAKLWPQAAHQLCVFHQTKQLVGAAKQTLNLIAKTMPKAPKGPGAIKRYPSAPPLAADPLDPATQVWLTQHAQLNEQVAQAQALKQLGYSLRAISRQLKVDHRRAKAWLSLELDSARVEQAVLMLKTQGPPLPGIGPLQVGKAKHKALQTLYAAHHDGTRLGKGYSATLGQLRQVEALAKQGLSRRAISRQTGLHRVTLANWLELAEQELPGIEQALAEFDQAELAQLKFGQAQRLVLLKSLSPKLPVARAQKALKLEQVQELARQKLSYSAIARLSGVHRVTISRWLKEEGLDPAPKTRPSFEGFQLGVEPPSLVSPTPSLASLNDSQVAGSAVAPFQQASKDPPPPLSPPAPWTSWQAVREVRTAYQKHSALVVRRPEHLSSKEKENLEVLLKSPVGEELRVVQRFMEEWYELWRPVEGNRPSLSQAQQHYEQWRSRQEYQHYAPLRREVRVLTPQRFLKLSQYLKNPHWEATNNGAERMGRAFRHRQAPHFNLRKRENLAGSLAVMAFQKKAQSEKKAAGLVVSSSSRGRKIRTAYQIRPAA